MDHSTGKKYHHIEEDLRNLIFSEEWHSGDKLPSENELAARYEVSRQTIRKALEALEHEGYIYAVHGSGRYISERAIHRKASGNIAVVLTYLSDYIFPKVISGIRQTSPDTLLIGFKLLSGVPHEELIDVGYRLLQKNDCDFVMANDSPDEAAREACIALGKALA